MEEETAAERLQNLQRDLIAFTESRMPSLERLTAELEGSIEDLRHLLDRKRKNEGPLPFVQYIRAMLQLTLVF